MHRSSRGRLGDFRSAVGNWMMLTNSAGKGRLVGTGAEWGAGDRGGSAGSRREQRILSPTEPCSQRLDMRCSSTVSERGVLIGRWEPDGRD